MNQVWNCWRRDKREDPDDIILNEWAARELGARPGDPVSLDYYVWHEDGRLETKTASFVSRPWFP